MAKGLVLLVLDPVLYPDERGRALKGGLHLQGVELVHGVDLVLVLVSPDDEATSSLIIDGVSHACQLNGDLVSPAVLRFNKRSGDGDYPRRLVYCTVLLVSEESVGAHFADELVGHADLVGPSDLDRPGDGHRVFGCEIDSVGGLLSDSVVGLIKLKFGNLGCKLVGDSRSILRVRRGLVQVLIDNHNV